MTKRTNEAWLASLQESGDEQDQALEDLHDFLFRAVLLYLRDQRTDLTHVSLTELRQMADDFTQEAVLSIQANLHKFRGDAKFTTWAYRFVINQAASELRRRYYRDRLSLEGLDEQEADILKSLTSSNILDPDLAAEREDFLNQFLHILQTSLNERQRLAIISVHLEGRSMQETAEFLETSTNTLYKILHDARKKIKGQLLTQHLGEGDILALFESKW